MPLVLNVHRILERTTISYCKLLGEKCIAEFGMFQVLERYFVYTIFSDYKTHFPPPYPKFGRKMGVRLIIRM